MYMYLYMYCTALLLRPAHCYAPSPHFSANFLYRVILPLLPPPGATRAGLRYCSSCMCTHVTCVEKLYSCNKRVESSGLGLFH